jgi:hypothetical protein
MLICGGEEPLQTNEMLDTRYEPTVLSDNEQRVVQMLNRYSFMWLGDLSEEDAAYARITQAITSDLTTKMTWLLVRQYHVTGDDRIRSLAWLSRRRKEGWFVYHDDTLAIASKEADDSEGDSVFPPGFDGVYDGHLLLAFGDTPPVEVFAKEPWRSSMQRVAGGGSPGRDTRVLAWLVDHHLSIAYERRDDVGRFGLVVMSPARIPIAEWQAQGLIHKIKTGTDVGDVWRVSPWYDPSHS